MTLSIFLYSLTIGILLYQAAAAYERYALDRGREVRLPWLAALVTTAVLPLLVIAIDGYFLPGSLAASRETGPLWGVGILWSQLQVNLLRVDFVLVGLWLAVSGGLAAWLVLWMLRSRRQVSGFEKRVVQGSSVLVGDIGSPAVIGFVAPRIILPRWVDEVDEADREYIMNHEAEHIRTHDPLMVLVGVLAVVIMPFNPMTWLMVRRLKLALELDCDARVLGRAGSDPRSYGSVLIEVSRRVSQAPLPVTAFSAGHSDLESRICNITRATGPVRRGSKVFLFLAFLMLAGVAALPDPTTGPCLVDFLIGF